MRTVAILYCDPKGVYPTLPGCDIWDQARDARLYGGPHPVVAHPPCARWCQLAGLVQHRYGYRKGDDGGTFEAALRSVRRHGGVLEHPAYTKAWPAHGLTAPTGHCWQMTIEREWVCQISQAAYGCRAQKLTWFLYSGSTPPASPDWSRPAWTGVVSGARNNCGRPLDERVWPREASATPPALARYLIELARQARPLTDTRKAR
jgi:hypothetical protein